MGSPHLSAQFDLDDLVDTATAAEQVRVEPATIRKWKQRELIQPSGLTEDGKPMYRLIDVLRAEQKTRQRGGTRRKTSNASADTPT